MNDNDNNNNETTTTSRDRYARAMSNDRFTIAQCARENAINEKIARRRMRNARDRHDSRYESLIALNNTNDARVVYEYAMSQYDIALSIIRRD